MFKNRYRLGVSLITLFLFGLGLPSAFAANGVFVYPNAGGAGWSLQAAGFVPGTNTLMVAGNGGSPCEFVAMSVTSSGTLNTAFGGGIVTTRTSTYEDVCNAAVVQPNGQLIAAGDYYISKTGVVGSLVVRYNTNGTLDKTFNGTGYVETNFSFKSAARAVALQSNGDILVAGQNFNPPNLPIVLQRYTTAGKLDTTFGSGGTLVNALSDTGLGWFTITNMALQSDGSIVVAGYAPGPKMGLIHYILSGTTWERDPNFGSGGIALFTPSGYDSYLSSIAIDVDNSIVATGYSYDASGATWATLARFTANGALDTTMGGNASGGGPGYILTAFGDPTDGADAFSVALQAIPGESDAYIVVSGWATNGNTFVARFDPYGNPDTSFGNVVVGGVRQGYSDLDFPFDGNDFQQSVLIQSDGKIVIAGGSESVRYNFNGTPDTSY